MRARDALGIAGGGRLSGQLGRNSALATAGRVDDDNTVMRLNRRGVGPVMAHQGPGGVAIWTAQSVGRAVIQLLAAMAEPNTHRRCGQMRPIRVIRLALHTSFRSSASGKPGHARLVWSLWHGLPGPHCTGRLAPRPFRFVGPPEHRAAVSIRRALRR